VLSIKWADVNLERATWTIPTTKTGDSLTVALVPEAVTILTERQGRAQGEYVFPARSKSGHLAEPKTAWARILKRAKITDLHLHDLRRTLGSWQAAQGASLVVIGKSLGHRNVSTTAIYSRLNLDPVRRSVEAATKAMLAAGGLVPTAEVVELKQEKGK
jgi:integrase